MVDTAIGLAITDAVGIPSTAVVGVDSTEAISDDKRCRGVESPCRTLLARVETAASEPCARVRGKRALRQAVLERNTRFICALCFVAGKSVLEWGRVLVKVGKIKLSGGGRTHIRKVPRARDLIFASSVVQYEVPS